MKEKQPMPPQTMELWKRPLQAHPKSNVTNAASLSGAETPSPTEEINTQNHTETFKKEGKIC